MAEHPGSRDTYDTIAQWIAPDFPFSTRDLWDRFGFIGVFSDYVLSCTQGDVLEIGAGESSIYLTRSATKFNRRIYYCDCGGGKLTNPMTIPGYLTDERELTYFRERDPMPDTLKRAVAYEGSSDSFFKRFHVSQLAFAFIDGDHTYQQVAKDFHNTWPYIVENGYVLLHDTYPPDGEWLDENHCGEVWKLRRELERDSSMDVLTLTRGTAVGVGLTIIRKHPSKSEMYHDG